MTYNAKYQREWRQNNKEKSSNYSAKWRANNPKYNSQAHTKRMLGEKSRALLLIKGAKRRAKEKNSQFLLTLNDVLPQIQKGKCELTGLSFDFTPMGKRTRNPYAPSIDRIDSSKGYTPDNVRIVLVAVNDCLNQYGEETILPILQALVKGIKRNVKKKPITSISKSDDRKSKNHAKRGVVHGAGSRKNGDNINNHCGTDAREDFDHRAEKSCGDSMGQRGKEMVAPKSLTRIENNGAPEAEIIRLDFGGGYLSD
jgi:hypothetical protein